MNEPDRDRSGTPDAPPTDLVERLRHGDIPEGPVGVDFGGVDRLLNEAADEIARLRAREEQLVTQMKICIDTIEGWSGYAPGHRGDVIDETYQVIEGAT